MSSGPSPEDFARRMTLAIKMADAAEAILERVRLALKEPFHLRVKDCAGIDPMLLALATEILLKAWITWDGKVSEKQIKTHELSKLFSYLQLEQREAIETAFARDNPWCAPNYMSLGRNVFSILDAHNKAFVEWRYVHEMTNHMSFSISDMEAVLVVMLQLFRGRYTQVNKKNIGNI